MEKAYTPGPWSYKLKVFCDGFKNDSPINPRTVKDYYTVEAGECFWDADDNSKGFGLTGYMSQANARLIAAAPEMLEALLACEVTLKAFLPEAFATISVVEEAIKKARGL